jgi:hypothetical protein
VTGKLGKLDVAQILEDFLEGTGGPWDWDDFISVGEVADERLRQIQQHVNLLSEEFPPENHPTLHRRTSGLVNRMCQQSRRSISTVDGTSPFPHCICCDDLTFTRQHDRSFAGYVK